MGFAYDNAGNLTADGTYTYDGDGRTVKKSGELNLNIGRTRRTTI